MEMGSTSGVKRCRMRMTSRLTAAYRRPSTGTKTSLGTQGCGGAQRHRRVDPEAPRLVGCGADDATVGGATTTHDHGPTAELRVVPLLDGREEGVEVDVQRGGKPHAAMMTRRARPTACLASPWVRPRW